MSEEFTASRSHPAEIAPARSHPAIVAAMVFAWLMLAAFALVAIAYMLGWLPKTAPGLPALATGAPKTAPVQAARTQSGVVLLPGETLVEAPQTRTDVTAAPPAPPPAKAGPVTPQYAKPSPKAMPAAPRAAPSQPAPRPVAPPRPSAFGPQPPAQYSQAEARERSARSICLNCATITSIRPRGDAWDVAVRFDDGSRETLRYYDPPALRVGDAVHLEDGRLICD